MLENLKELYLHFKETNLNLKIGFSKFAELKPKWCILAGPGNPHTVCVCIKHENKKLMTKLITPNISLKDLLSLGVCNVENENCMLSHCENCPGFTDISEIIKSCIDEEEMVTYKQWVTVDRADLITVVQSRSDFLETVIQG